MALSEMSPQLLDCLQYKLVHTDMFHLRVDCNHGNDSPTFPLAGQKFKVCNAAVDSETC